MSGVGLKKAWKKQLARYTSALKYSAAISKNTKLSFKIKGTVTYKKSEISHCSQLKQDMIIYLIFYLTVVRYIHIILMFCFCFF